MAECEHELEGKHPGESESEEEEGGVFRSHGMEWRRV